MRLFASSNPLRVMASGAMDVNHKDEVYDGKVTFCWLMVDLSDRKTIKLFVLKLGY